MPSAKLNPSCINQARLTGITTELPPAPAEGPWPTEVLLFTQMPVAEALGWQREAAERMRAGKAAGHRLVLTEHPPTLVRRAADETHGTDGTKATHAAGASGGWAVLDDPAAGEARLTSDALFIPGVMTAWLTLHRDHLATAESDPAAMGMALLGKVLNHFGIDTAPAPDGRKLTTGDGRAAATIGWHAEEPAVFLRLSIHTNPDIDLLGALPGPRPPMVSMTELGMPVHRQDEVRAALLQHYEQFFGSTALIPQRTGVRMAKPPWLRVKLPVSAATRPVHDIVRERGLHTVCESARCPNQGECWGGGTATFMINGDVCTRSCSFCAIFTGRPRPLDPDEPRRVGEAARLMGLRYAVVTAVNRDELADGGAGAFAATIRELREAVPGIRIEVLIPDFRGEAKAMEAVFLARPDVLNHNVETVPRLYSRVRPQAIYERSLAVISAAKEAGLTTKSGLMLGLGEEGPEVEALLADLRRAGCDIVTIGQYLRPSEYHHPVVRFATPGEFAHWRTFGLELGFQAVQSGPLVRSSYHANESFADAEGPAGKH